MRSNTTRHWVLPVERQPRRRIKRILDVLLLPRLLMSFFFSPSHEQFHTFCVRYCWTCTSIELQQHLATVAAGCCSDQHPHPEKSYYRTASWWLKLCNQCHGQWEIVPHPARVFLPLNSSHHFLALKCQPGFSLWRRGVGGWEQKQLTVTWSSGSLGREGGGKEGVDADWERESEGIWEKVVVRVGRGSGRCCWGGGMKEI